MNLTDWNMTNYFLYQTGLYLLSILLETCRLTDKQLNGIYMINLRIIKLAMLPYLVYKYIILYLDGHSNV